MNNQTAQLLKQHFDTAFAAPDGIKKLRELILTLAMQGKLVAQDPNDPPARELLKEIEVERRRLVKEGKVKQPKLSPEIKAEEVPYALPQEWEWVRLGEIVSLLGDGIHGTPNYDETGKFFFINGNNLSDGAIEIKEHTKRVSFDEFQKHKKDLNERTMLVSINGTIGNVAFYNSETVILGKSACYFNLFSQIDKHYIKKLINSNYFLGYAFSAATGSTIKNVSLKSMREFLVPLPPLPEQHRIVAKIDQLMARCDELGKLHAEREQKRFAIHTAALRQLLDAQEQDSSANAWQFLTRHFSGLYSVKENVAELRKAILQLAVMGKLVPQDPTDPPTSELLKEIKTEKQRLIKGGKIKKPKPLPEIKAAEMWCALPVGWKWVRLGDVSLGSDSGWSPQCLPEPRRGNEWGVLKVSAVSWGTFKPDENKALPPDNDPRPECEVKCGDFLISRANTDELVARSVIVIDAPPKLMMSDKIVRFSLSQHVIKQFINVVNVSKASRFYYISNASGTSSSMKNVSRSVMTELPVPLPPLPEQHRIVAKIDQLMTLCDRLDQQIDAATGKQTELLNAVMAQV